MKLFHNRDPFDLKQLIVGVKALNGMRMKLLHLFDLMAMEKKLCRGRVNLQRRDFLFDLLVLLDPRSLRGLYQKQDLNYLRLE